VADGQPVVTETEPSIQDALEGLLAVEDGEPEAEAPQAGSEPETEAGEPETADVETEGAETEAPKTWKVKVDGEEVEVPEDELLRGYSRQQDYTRKTMKLAEERKALEAAAQESARVRQEYAERLEAMKTFLDQQSGPEPDWDRLRAENPTEYAVKVADWQRQQAAKDKVVAEQQRLRVQEVQEQQARLQAKVAEERERLLEALPEWKQAETAKREQEALMQYGTGVGFTEDELGNLYDHRAVLLLRKAMLFDQAQAKGKTVLKEKAVTPQVLKPGPKSAEKPKSSARDDLAKKFAKTRHPNDAAALIESMLVDNLLE
jgi:hypothetical protein